VGLRQRPKQRNNQRKERTRHQAPAMDTQGAAAPRVGAMADLAMVINDKAAGG